MAKATLLWSNYRYFPYEKKLAVREVRTVTGGDPYDIPGGLEVEINGCPPTRLRRLTYFREVILSDGTRLVPDQTVVENGRGNTLQPAGRQRTRYSLHGLHEYRGKFNPQVVRAVANCLGVEPGMWLLDPCCGSGTSLLEARLMGVNAIGTDINPLAVYIANAKLSALSSAPRTLDRSLSTITAEVDRTYASQSFSNRWSDETRDSLAGKGWRKRLPDYDYLAEWFPTDVLAQAASLLRTINMHSTPKLTPFFRVVLSDLLRETSLQDPDDLRIRRRKQVQENYPLAPLFLAKSQRQVVSLLQVRMEGVVGRGRQLALLHDNREPLAYGQERATPPAGFGGFHAAITSPPYATALPYIDTQRLSLSLLGLVPASRIAHLDRSLTGTREMTTHRRRSLEAKIAVSDRSLPGSIISLCTRMQGMLGANDGFRRQRMPALVYAYFVDIAAMLDSVRSVMRTGAPFALLVGRNRTVLGGEEVIVDTPLLLGEVADERGWTTESLTEFNTYQRYSLHSRNSIRSETLVVLRKA